MNSDLFLSTVPSKYNAELRTEVVNLQKNYSMTFNFGAGDHVT